MLLAEKWERHRNHINQSQQNSAANKRQVIYMHYVTLYIAPAGSRLISAAPKFEWAESKLSGAAEREDGVHVNETAFKQSKSAATVLRFALRSIPPHSAIESSDELIHVERKSFICEVSLYTSHLITGWNTCLVYHKGHQNSSYAARLDVRANHVMSQNWRGELRVTCTSRL